jgi:hypothetical protein
MEDRPTTPQPPAVSIDDLRLRYGRDWEIQRCPGGLPVWTAEHRSGDGRSIRCLVGHTPAELAARLETAELVEP